MKEMHHHLDNVVIPTLSKKIPNWNKMNDNQQAALISFSYNAGQNFYKKEGYETITKALSKESNWNNVPTALNLYNKGFDEVLLRIFHSVLFVRYILINSGLKLLQLVYHIRFYHLELVALE
jgi:GH24 family phage-related lysozyme (muramidase)